MSIKNKFGGMVDDNAVSPVIGVILMVAITVILAAVIGSVVLDLGGGVNENVNAYVELTQENDGVKAYVQDMGNADEIFVKVNGDKVDNSSLTGVGQSVTVTSDKNDEVTVVAQKEGSSSSSQVVQSTAATQDTLASGESPSVVTSGSSEDSTFATLFSVDSKSEFETNGSLTNTVSDSKFVSDGVYLSTEDNSNYETKSIDVSGIYDMKVNTTMLDGGNITLETNTYESGRRNGNINYIDVSQTDTVKLTYRGPFGGNVTYDNITATETSVDKFSVGDSINTKSKFERGFDSSLSGGASATYNSDSVTIDWSGGNGEYDTEYYNISQATENSNSLKVTVEVTEVTGDIAISNNPSYKYHYVADPDESIVVSSTGTHTFTVSPSAGVTQIRIGKDSYNGDESITVSNITVEKA